MIHGPVSGPGLLHVGRPLAGLKAWANELTQSHRPDLSNQITCAVQQLGGSPSMGLAEKYLTYIIMIFRGECRRPSYISHMEVDNPCL